MHCIWGLPRSASTRTDAKDPICFTTIVCCSVDCSLAQTPCLALRVSKLAARFAEKRGCRVRFLAALKPESPDPPKAGDL